MDIKKAISVFIIVAVVFLAVELLFNKGLVFNLTASPSNAYNYTYGEFRVYVYNPERGTVSLEDIKGIMLCINNVDVQNLQILSIYNSTFSTVPVYYIQTPVPLPNGSVVEGFERTYNIYIGYVKVLVSTQGLSPGQYVISLSDGTTIPVDIT